MPKIESFDDLGAYAKKVYSWYIKDNWSEVWVKNAVGRKITQDECDFILGSK